MSQTSTSLKPHLILAIYNWCIENNLDPYLLVYSGTDSLVPGYISQGEKTAFNIGEDAVTSLYFGDNISFKARFTGQLEHLSIPIGDVLGIYANGDNTGFIFDRDILVNTPTEAVAPKKKAPFLTVIK